MPETLPESRAHHDRHAADVSVLVTPARFSAAAPRLDASGIAGTIGAAMQPIEPHFYGSTVASLILGRIGPGAIPTLLKPSSLPAPLRASDLIGELREINGQVNRMMAQVERAIDRLTVHVG